MKTAARVIITGWEARLDFRAYHFCFTKSTKIVPNWNNIVLRLSIIEKYFHHNCFLISQIEFILTFLTTNYYHFFSKYVQNLNLQSTILILLWLGDSPINRSNRSNITHDTSHLCRFLLRMIFWISLWIFNRYFGFMQNILNIYIMKSVYQVLFSIVDR